MQPDNLEFWIDLNLPSVMARWIREDFKVSAKSLVELKYDKYSDYQIFQLAAARANTIVITTKDNDFAELTETLGAPPKILYLNVGNLSKNQLKLVIQKSFQQALDQFLHTDNTIIEITI
jgi:predicted nuclease of predicted toxin-antitoxin system